MKKTIISAVLLFALTLQGFCAPAFDVEANYACLMEQTTGKVLFEKNMHERLAPASVTKIMTMLLVMEAIDEGRISFNDEVTVSAYASQMGGTQVYLSPGEVMSVNDLLKSVAVASANDASVALAEFLCGTEESFAGVMNERAKQLGMNDTNFVNCTGFDAPNHLTSPYDIALMSRELLKHSKIIEFTTIWMDTIRNGEFGLSNTNRLIKSYNGITGLKTGSTSIAKNCLSATATRDGLSLIAVDMACPTTDIRFKSASSLLDYGFGNFLIKTAEAIQIPNIEILNGKEKSLSLVPPQMEGILLEKKDAKEITTQLELPQKISAPVKEGQTIGFVKVYLGNEEIKKIPVLATKNVEKKTYFDVAKHLLCKLFGIKN